MWPSQNNWTLQKNKMKLQNRVQPIFLWWAATSGPEMTHRRVDDIQSAPFFLWVIHESKNEVVGNGLNKRIHAIFWQLNFQSRIKKLNFQPRTQIWFGRIISQPATTFKDQTGKTSFLLLAYFFMLFCLFFVRLFNGMKHFRNVAS